MSECLCKLQITKTIISKNGGRYGIEYGIGNFMDYRVRTVTDNCDDIKLPGTLFCPHNLPENFEYAKHFSVIITK